MYLAWSSEGHNHQHTNTHDGRELASYTRVGVKTNNPGAGRTVWTPKYDGVCYGIQSVLDVPKPCDGVPWSSTRDRQFRSMCVTIFSGGQRVQPKAT